MSMSTSETSSNSLGVGTRVLTPIGLGIVAIRPWQDASSHRMKCRVRIDGTPRYYYLAHGKSNNDVYYGPYADKLLQRTIFFCEEIALISEEEPSQTPETEYTPRMKSAPQQSLEVNQWWTEY